jgi:hypothetical protein
LTEKNIGASHKALLFGHAGRSLDFSQPYCLFCQMNQASNPSSRSHAVMLPCTPDQFSNFIGGLLGKPQTITQNFRGSFEIAAHDLVNIHQLLNQRITQQNGGDLLQFTARIIFHDNSSVLINDYEDLLSYNEIRPVVAKQIHLSWMYLIRFNNREFPEKQTIDLSFLSENGSVIFDETASAATYMRGGSIGFRIQHTARTWGADIQALLDNHLQGVLTHESTPKIMARRHRSKLQFLAFSTVLGSAFYATYRSSQELLVSRKAALALLIGRKGDLDSKINGILTLLYDDPWKNFWITSVAYWVIAFVFACIAGSWVGSTISKSKPSFILLTARSEQYKRTLLSDYRRQWYSFCASIVVSIITGTISSIIYAKFWGN